MFPFFLAGLQFLVFEVNTLIILNIFFLLVILLCAFFQNMLTFRVNLLLYFFVSFLHLLYSLRNDNFFLLLMVMHLVLAIVRIKLFDFLLFFYEDMFSHVGA